MSLEPLSGPLLWTSCLALLLASVFVTRSDANPARYPDEAPFLAANNAAMSRMMRGMAIRPTGHVDADFAAMMIPHHRGAIDMAEAELRFGQNEQLRRIAQEMIVDQGQEIAAMQLALGQPLPPSAPAPTGGDAPSSRAPTPDAAPVQRTIRPMENTR